MEEVNGAAIPPKPTGTYASLDWIMASSHLFPLEQEFSKAWQGGMDNHTFLLCLLIFYMSLLGEESAMLKSPKHKNRLLNEEHNPKISLFTIAPRP